MFWLYNQPTLKLTLVFTLTLTVIYNLWILSSEVVLVLVLCKIFNVVEDKKEGGGGNKEVNCASFLRMEALIASGSVRISSLLYRVSRMRDNK
jgi:hypothetical protein